MRQIRFILLLIFSLITGQMLKAQDAWNLNKCISYAIQNNIGLKRMEIDEKLVSEDFRQSKRNLLPAVGFSSNAGISFGRSVDPNTNDIVNNQFFNSSYGVGSSMPLFNGFRMIRQIEYQKFRQKAAEQNRLNAIDDLAFQVMGSYFEVLYYEGLLKIAGQQVEASAFNLKKVEKQVDLGMKSRTDLYEMRANYEAEELFKIQTGNRLNSVTLELKQLMNHTDIAPLVLEEDSATVITGLLPDQQLLLSSFLEWSPAFQSTNNLLKASKKQLSVSRSMWFPSMNASGSVSSGFYETNKDEFGKTIDFSKQFNNNLSQYLGASISLPVFSRWSRLADIKKAKLSIEEAQVSMDEQKQKIWFEMVNNLNDLLAFEKEHNQYLKQLEADLLVFQAAERKMEQGLISVVDFYIAKNRLANTQSQVLASRLQWEIRKKSLDFYRGKRFWEE
jgi:outer membrane protein